MKLRTPFTEMLGIAIPVVQAPVGGVSSPELVAAVSNAGGLGTLSMTWRELDAVPTLLRRIKELTPRPFGVNFVLEWNPGERLDICLDAGVKLVSFFWGDPSPWVE